MPSDCHDPVGSSESLTEERKKIIFHSRGQKNFGPSWNGSLSTAAPFGWCLLARSEVLLTSEVVFNASNGCNKAAISVDVPPAGVKSGQCSIYIKWLKSGFVLFEGLTKDTKYE